MTETPREVRNRRYRDYLARNPGRSYAQWLHDAAVTAVRNGSPHPTLGGNLNIGDWWDAGRPTFNRYLKLFALQPDNKVVDYGCGSLRVGGHFIRHLNPGGYFGLDVTTGLIEVGKDLIGSALLAEKEPRFGPIDEPSLAQAAEFGADLICSTAVCYHVHPDEAAAYFANLISLTAKPGATLAFDVSLSDEPVADHALSMPIDYFIEQLRPLAFVAFHKNAAREDNKQILGIAQFRREEAPAAGKRSPANEERRR